MIVRLIKLLGSIIFWVFDSIFDLIGRIFRKKREGVCTVLYYHSIPTEHQEKFSRQMDIFKKVITPVSAGHHDKMKQGIKYGSITFDDGFVCVINNAVPELIKRDIPFTIFIPTGYLEQAPLWMRDSKKYSDENSIMSSGQLKTIEKMSQASIGSHSITHRSLLKISTEEAENEFADSKKTLEQILDKKIDLFSFPYGDFNERHISIAKKLGYRRIFSNIPVPAHFGKNEFVIGRTPVEPTDWDIEFRLKILGAYRWLPVAFRVKRVLKKIVRKRKKL